jgi:hypothetical protein
LHLLRTILHISISALFFFVSSYYRSIFHLYLENTYQTLSSKAQVLVRFHSYAMFNGIILSVCRAFCSLTSPKNPHFIVFSSLSFSPLLIFGFSVVSPQKT